MSKNLSKTKSVHKCIKLFIVFKLRLGALIPRSVSLSVCLSVCRSVSPPKIAKKITSLTKHQSIIINDWKRTNLT